MFKIHLVILFSCILTDLLDLLAGYIYFRMYSTSLLQITPGCTSRCTSTLITPRCTSTQITHGCTFTQITPGCTFTQSTPGCTSTKLHLHVL